MKNMRLSTALAALSLAVAAVAAGQTVESFDFDPAVIRQNTTTNVALSIGTAGSVTSVTLDLANGGGTITLSQAGSGNWTATIPSSKLSAGYTPAEVNRHFVGFIHLKAPGVDIPMAFNAAISVLDGNVPRVTIGNHVLHARITPHIVNFHWPNSDFATSQSPAVDAIHSLLGTDAYDFVNVVYVLPSYPVNRYHGALRVTASGTGTPVSSSSGNPPRLQGFTIFPLDTYFDMADFAAKHELGHQWSRASTAWRRIRRSARWKRPAGASLTATRRTGTSRCASGPAN